jgi:DNA repair protein RecN (Recombination protein N)
LVYINAEYAARGEEFFAPRLDRAQSRVNMLKLLSIKNLAVVDQLQIEFAEGLNVLTGETGSGKSIIIDALDLLLGGRASQDMIRTGVDRGSVEGVFDSNPLLVKPFEEAGIEFDESEVIVRREIATSGRGRIFVNNQASTAAFLKLIQPALLDIHGQGDQQSLIHPSTHLLLLDLFAGVADKRSNIEAIYILLTQVLDEIARGLVSESSRMNEVESIRQRLDEIGNAALKPNEDTELETERSMLANAERLTRLTSDSYGLLYENEDALVSRMGSVARQISELAEIDERFGPFVEQLSSARYALEEIAFFLRGYITNIQGSPDRLAAVEARLAQLERLKRKYNLTLADIEEMRASLRNRLEILEGSDGTLAGLGAKVTSLMRQYQLQATEMSDERRRQARRFEKELTKAFVTVALDKARFQIRFAPPENPVAAERLAAWIQTDVKTPPLARFGSETVQFYFTANPGEELKPLSGVASGGELSRLMLLIKNVVAPTIYPRTLIFDEIDQGIGGRVADAVGTRLQSLARTNQVLCVTHQPQIARYADAHFLIQKTVEGERTRTSAMRLDQAGRVDELARMLAGAEITPSARKHARELMKTSGQEQEK